VSCNAIIYLLVYCHDTNIRTHYDTGLKLLAPELFFLILAQPVYKM
jgi:hypothetical protein